MNPPALSTWFRIILILFSFFPATGCDESTNPGGSINPRSYAMGFTSFPYDGGLNGLLFAREVIRTKGDLVVMHFDNGIPWDASLANDFSAYPADLRSEIDGFNSSYPQGHRRYLAITPIAVYRDRLAPSRKANGSTAFEAPWDTLSFDHTEVVQAYVNHCRILIDRLRPDFFAYAIESNILREKRPDSIWTQFVSFSTAVYDSIKRSHPKLPVFQTLHVGTFYRDVPVQTAAIGQIMPVSDFLAVSAYPYGDYERYGDQNQANPASLPPDYFTDIAALAPAKPFAVAETGWPSEDVTSPYPITIRSTPEFQKQYVSLLLRTADDLHARFVSWFLTRDYDAFWNATLRATPDSALVRLWKDVGLYDGDGTPKPALKEWERTHVRPRR